MFVAGENFLTGTNYDIPTIPFAHKQEVSIALDLLQNTSKMLEKLENKECIESYFTGVVSNYGNLLLVSSYQDENNSLLGLDGCHVSALLHDKSSEWMNFSSLPCNITMSLTALAEAWTRSADGPKAFDEHLMSGYYGSYAISYCLSKMVEDRCELHFNTAIMVVVTICNVIKLVCMTTMAWNPEFQSLVTLGDAIASFLRKPDGNTLGMCLGDKSHFSKFRNWQPSRIPHSFKHHFWYGAASFERWCISNVLSLVTLVTACSLLLGRPNGSVSIWKIGLGTIRPDTILGLNNPQGSLLGMILLANTPQLLLSFHYFMYNSLYTTMLLGKEWSDYAHQRKSLSVTSPTGQQRTTYRLQLPYRYGIPFLVMSGTLHWLISESIFLVSIKSYYFTGSENPKNNIITCGYSPIATIVTVIVGAMGMLLTFVIGYRRYKPGMPLVGSCSAAISAACHPPDGDKDATVSRLRWEVVEDPQSKGQRNVVDHCSFTSFKVTKPVAGRRYA